MLTSFLWAVIVLAIVEVIGGAYGLDTGAKASDGAKGIAMAVHAALGTWAACILWGLR